VTIRPAAKSDRAQLRELREEFQRELGKPTFLQEPWDAIASDVDDTIREGVALLAEENGEVVGYALASVVPETPIRGHLYDLFVREVSRKRGVGRSLVAEVARRFRERGVTHLSLDVGIANDRARRLYERLGFFPYEVFMAAPLEDLERRLDSPERAPSLGSTHVQTDDEAAVNRAVTQFLPRLGRTEWTEVSEARNGWVTVLDELCDHDRSAQRRLGRELSERMGVPVLALALEEEQVVRFLLFERGRLVDEYVSVPSYYGELSKADELSLAANATLVSRLTGADPALVRAVARNASSPAELPPARELLAQIAEVFGVEARIDR
jgi:[ribosomal protein S18]-alanine N-acetyltransferase